MSHRKDIKHQADLLRRSGQFDPSRVHRPSADEQLRELAQGERNAKVQAEADTCDECRRAREANGEADALCREHLARALGF